jgi:transcriptional regulator with XRE-family HTH domain
MDNIQWSRRLGQILKQARLDAGLTQVKVAADLGISEWTYSRLENGHRQFDEEWLARLPLPVRRPVLAFFEQQSTQRLMTLRRLGLTEHPLVRPAI